MRAIVRRLARLEVKLVPRESAESARLRERLYRARLRLAAAGETYDGISQRPITDLSAHLSLGERILLARRAYAESGIRTAESRK